MQTRSKSNLDETMDETMVYVSNEGLNQLDILQQWNGTFSSKMMERSIPLLNLNRSKNISRMISFFFDGILFYWLTYCKLILNLGQLWVVVCACACMRACVHACVRARVCYNQ